MEKELIQLYEAAQKAADVVVDGGAEEDRCIDALNQLKNFPVNYQVLVSSQVGKRLRGLTKHSSNKIKVLASEVVEIWKDIIVKETMKNKKNGEIKSEGSAKVEKTKSVKVETMATVKVGGNNLTGTSNSDKLKNSESDKKVMDVDIVKTKRSHAEQIKVEKTTNGEKSSQIKVEKIIKEEKLNSRTSEQIKVEKIIKEEKSSSNFSKPKDVSVAPPKLHSIVSCKDAVRDKMREILAEALCKVSSEVDKDLRDDVNACDPYRVAVQVETAMFEKWGKSNGIQKVKYRSIMFNIKDPKNPDFRRRVLLGEYDPHTITELTPEEMASDERKKQIEDIKEKALFDCERGQAQKASTNEFKCSRCGKRETTYYQMQTRSADEPMTTYVTCVNCGKRWKFC